MDDPPKTDCPSAMVLEAFLREGGSDADLARHIESCPHCKTVAADIRDNNAFMSRLAHVATEQRDPLPRAGAPTDLIDGYRLHEEIHRGGQGVVYRATQTATGRNLAVKVLLGGTLATSAVAE